MAHDLGLADLWASHRSEDQDNQEVDDDTSVLNGKVVGFKPIPDQMGVPVRCQAALFGHIGGDHKHNEKEAGASKDMRPREIICDKSSNKDDSQCSPN